MIMTGFCREVRGAGLLGLLGGSALSFGGLKVSRGALTDT
jgi:hypothetical protein